MKKEINIFAKIFLVLLAIFLVGSYLDYQVTSYRSWVKERTMDAYETCLLFESPGSQCAVLGDEIRPGTYDIVGSTICSSAKETTEEAHESCREYATDKNLFSPYPWYKAIVFMDF